MQAEAGQALERIVARKEAERAAGGGVFFWGVGSSLGARVSELLKREQRPKVLFSIMKSQPKSADRSPRDVFMWTSFLDLAGRKWRMPPHVIVLSRAYTPKGPKTRHYALVCHSERELQLRADGFIELGAFRNLGSATNRVGSSQVTAIVEHASEKSRGPWYAIDLVAELVEPYFVRLVDPVLVPPRDRELMNQTRPDSQIGWLTLVERIRKTCNSPLVSCHP